MKVGDYIRTYEGIIGKIYEEDDIGENGVCIDTTFFDDYAEETNFVKYKDIKKHSARIIDLIEVGDVVNNGYICEIGNSEDGYKWVHNLNGFLLFEKDIKTILTHEQYQANCYTVERKEEC